MDESEKMSMLEHKPNFFERMAIALEKQNKLIESQNLILGEIAYQLKIFNNNGKD